MRTEWRHASSRRQRWLASGLLLAIPAIHAMDLTTAVHKAQVFDPTLRAAQYAYQAGLEKGKQGTALYLPQISANSNINYLQLNSQYALPPGLPSSVLVGNANGYLYGFGITLIQPIYNAAAFAGAAELKDQAKLASLQKQGADTNLILRVAQAYFGVLMAQNNLELSHEQQAAIVQQLASARGRFKAGKTDIIGVRDAEARDQEIRAQVISAANNLSVQQAQFASIVGQSPGHLDAVAPSFTPTAPQPDVLDTWLGWGRQGNLNVLSAHLQADINKHEIDKYRLRSRPQVSLVASYADIYQNGSLPVLVTPDELRQAMVGIQLSVPLFTGGSYNSKYREAVAEHEQAQYQLQATLENTDVQVKQQFLNVKVGTQQIPALQAAVVAAKSSLDATVLGLKVGKRTTLDVLNAQQQYFSSQQNLDAARYQYLLSRLNLAALVNRLGTSELAEVNKYLEQFPHGEVTPP